MGWWGVSGWEISYRFDHCARTGYFNKAVELRSKCLEVFFCFFLLECIRKSMNCTLLTQTAHHPQRQIHKIQIPWFPPPSCPHLLLHPIIPLKNQQRQLVSHHQSNHPTNPLHKQSPHRQSILLHRSKPHQKQIQYRHITRLHYLPLTILLQCYQRQPRYAFRQHLQPPRHKLIGRSLPLCDTRLQQPRPRIKPRQAMSRARHKVEKLRGAVHKVEDLRD